MNNKEGRRETRRWRKMEKEKEKRKEGTVVF